MATHSSHGHAPTTRPAGKAKVQGPESACKSLNEADEVRPFPKGRLEVCHFGPVTVGRAYFQPGWKWSESVKPIAQTQLCEVVHTGYCLAGRMHVQMKDGTVLEIHKDDAFAIPAGHDAWVVGDEECVMIDVSGAQEYAKAN